MPAQQLETLENNESIHANPCGEYAVRRLQMGARSADVQHELLHEYLVHVSLQRLAA